VSIELDLYSPRLASAASGLLSDFNLAGVLSAADVHVALRLGAIGGEADEEVLLACALAVRAPRLGHVHVDLRRIRETAAVEGEEGFDLLALPWPEPEQWLARVAGSALVGDDRPLRLEGSWLYLERYFSDERQLAADLLDMAHDAMTVSEAHGLDGADPDQQRAIAGALAHRFSVIAGGPGTGKTTTVARIVAELLTEAAVSGRRPPLIALAAPTGKAAARLEQAVHDAAGELAISPEVRSQMLALEGSTLHRLLGRRRDSNSRFRHDRRQRLPHDVVIVDETSMVSLSLMARLVEAVRPSSRLVLVGDPGQLASIEAGAVLGDIVGPAAGAAPARGPLADHIVVLERGHRFGGTIAALAGAVRAGDAVRALELLGAGDGVRWLPVDAGEQPDGALAEVRAAVDAAARRVLDAARAGDAETALAALGEFRLLCAHRHGPHGVSGWNARVESWLAASVDGFDAAARWYPGRPLLVTENDYELGLYNGDTGVIVQRPDGGVAAAFERRGEIVDYSPTRLQAFETVHAMTIHKSQGSQFATAAVLLPEPDSRLLTRELLYTALTRARRTLIVVGSEQAIRAAIERPIARASGLRGRLWPQ
jgi:exodeoxyribonuclease V alpha subunit